MKGKDGSDLYSNVQPSLTVLNPPEFQLMEMEILAEMWATVLSKHCS